MWFQNRRTKHKRIQSDDVTDDDDMTSRAAADADAMSSDEELLNVDCSSPTSATSSPHHSTASPRESPVFHQEQRFTPTTTQSSPLPIDCHQHRPTHYPDINPKHNHNPNFIPNIYPNSNQPNVNANSDDRRHSNVVLPGMHHNFRSAAAMFAHHGDYHHGDCGATVTMTSSFAGT